MGNGNRTSGGDFQSVKPFECDVGLGLNTVESSSSYPYKKMNFMSSNSEIYGNTNQFTSGFCSKSATDRVMGISGKVLFTANQWQELERQTMIYKYIMASVPVPPHLLLPLSTQSNRPSSGLRFSNGSDPEPWRCRRTDGKKWRCAKDVAPDQKYCERHAHKTRSRSRKPVEIKDNNNPTIISPANQQNRCNNDWLMKNGATATATPVSQLNNQFHFQPSIQPPNSGSKRDYKQDFTGNHEHKKTYFDANDVWSRIGGGDHRDDCSLTLSMQSGGGFDHESFEMAVGMLNGDNRGVCGDVFKPTHQWLTHGSWTGSTTPGGPLGEALCLGITGTENLDQNESSSHGYNDSGITNSSSFDGFH